MANSASSATVHSRTGLAPKQAPRIQAGHSLDLHDIHARYYPRSDGYSRVLGSDAGPSENAWVGKAQRTCKKGAQSKSTGHASIADACDADHFLAFKLEVLSDKPGFINFSK